MFVDKHGDVKVGSVITFVGLILVALIALGMWGCPSYMVYSATKSGEAELKKAENTKQIMIRHAEADLEAAKLNAEAEVVRAEGVRAAAEIEAGALTENYIKWQLIRIMDGWAQAGNKIIYIPTEAMIPILDAGKR